MMRSKPRPVIEPPVPAVCRLAPLLRLQEAAALSSRLIWSPKRGVSRRRSRTRPPKKAAKSSLYVLIRTRPVRGRLSRNQIGAQCPASSVLPWRTGMETMSLIGRHRVSAMRRDR